MSVTEALAEYVTHSTLDAIPRDVRDEAKRAIFNYLGCALGGAVEPALDVAIKTLAFDEAVNVTLGLPFVRTSPDHGTAFDIAGTGRANPESLVASLKLAAELAARETASRSAA